MAEEAFLSKSNSNNEEPAKDCQPAIDANRPQGQNDVHYPLNGVELDFRRYAHRPLGPRDIIMSRIAEDFMQPRRATAKVYLQETPKHYFIGQVNPHISQVDPSISLVKARDREFGLDLQVANRMLLTKWNNDQPSDPKLEQMGWYKAMHPSARLTPWYHCRNRSSTEFQAFPALDEVVYGLLQRHYLERTPALEAFLEFVEHLGGLRASSSSSGWRKDMVEHLKTLKPSSEMQHRLQLYSGGHPYSAHGQTDPQFFIGPCVMMLRSDRFFYHLRDSLHKFIKILRAGGDPRPSNHLPLHNVNFVQRGKPRRRHSLPPYGIRCSVVWKECYILFPRRPLSEIDKLSRRRSLSRSHIRAMFRDRSPMVRNEAPGQSQAKGTVRPGNTCKNCTKSTHPTAKCWSNCGYCNSESHKADTCPVKPINRCKCQPFPQLHTVSDCFVRCSRRCGSSYPPGHFKHKNAMLCSHRCCMCGLRGHNGRKCNLRQCRCGETHLTQDCRWKVECPAKSCDRYLCTEHCRECGRTRNKELKEYFVGMTCPPCLRNGNPVAPKAESTL